MPKKLKFWGWGYEGDGLTGDEQQVFLRTFADGFANRPVASQWTLAAKI